MAETKTDTGTVVTGQSAGGKVLKQYRDKLTSAVAALGSAEIAVATATLTLGRIITECSRDMLAAKTSAEDVQASILDVLASAGRSVEWKTVERWTSAVAIADSLPETVRDAFGVDALIALKGIKADDRSDFAEGLVAAGQTSVYKVRDAVREYKGPPRKVPGTNERAAKLTKTGREHADYAKVRETLARYGMGPVLEDGTPNDQGMEDALTLARYFVSLGQNFSGNGKPGKHYIAAADELIGPEPVAESAS